MRILASFCGLLLMAQTLVAHPPAFPANPSGRVTVTCTAKVPGVIAWIQTAFAPAAMEGTYLSLIGDPSVDAYLGSAGARYLPYAEGPNQGWVQAWGTVSPTQRAVLNLPVKHAALFTSQHDAVLTLERLDGARDIALGCCFGRLGPVGSECQSIERAMLLAIQATAGDASLADSEKYRRIERLTSMSRIW